MKVPSMVSSVLAKTGFERGFIKGRYESYRPRESDSGIQLVGKP